MSEYYLGDPCYVIPDAEWGAFCQELGKHETRAVAHFVWKDRIVHTCGTGGDGDFGGLSVDAGLLSILPVEVCDPVLLKEVVKSGDARLIDYDGELESWECGVITLNGEPLNGYECGCGCGEIMAEGHEVNCGGCGEILYFGCADYRNGDPYCGEGCMPELTCEVCGDDDDGLDESNPICDDCNTHSMCGCPKDDPHDTEENCADCRADEEE